MSQTGASDSRSLSPQQGATADDIAVVALDRRAKDSQGPRVEALPVMQDQARDYRPGPVEVFVSRYFEFNSTIAVCGGTGLAEFCQRRTQLDHLVDKCHTLGGHEPLAQRFVGPLESCLLCRDGVWTDIGSGTNGRLFVIGMDMLRGRLYAFHERKAGVRDEICYAEIKRGPGTLDWNCLTGLPRNTDATAYLDASHFVQTPTGPCGVIRIAKSDGRIEHRLLTIEEEPQAHGTLPMDNWSVPMSEDFAVFRPDRRPATNDSSRSSLVTGLLIEKRIAGGYRIKRKLMKHWAEPAYAYFNYELRRLQSAFSVPPVLRVT
jgi:hypothetical protein